MLAITPTHAYEICVLKINGECKDTWDCTDNKYILDLNVIILY